MNLDRKFDWRGRFLRSRFVAVIARVRSWFVPAGARWGKFDIKDKLDKKEQENGSKNR